MSRQRVSKGSVIPKKEFKIATVLSSLPVGCDFDSFFSEFKRVYPKDWERVNKRYQEHERLTKPGKSPRWLILYLICELHFVASNKI
jgi:hypothetical protein